jgi:hypothetical protein
MSDLEDVPEFEPTLGEGEPLSASLPEGVRVRAERAFIKMVQAGFYEHEVFPYHPDDEKGRLAVRSAVSKENLAWIPRVEVRIGPLDEYGGSIDNLNKWSKTLRRHVYADQAQVAFICTTETEAESSDLGERVRRLLSIARRDPGKKGIFGMSQPKLEPPQAARPGSQDDHVYQSVVRAPFLAIERQERAGDESDPRLEATSQTVTISNAPEKEEGDLGPVEMTPTQFRLETTSTGVRGTLTLSRNAGTYQVGGVTVTVPTGTRRPPVVRNEEDFSELIVELERVEKGTPVTIEYAPGNLEDETGHPAAPFGPITGTWA